MMMPWGGMGWGWYGMAAFGWLFMVIFWVLIIAGVVLLVRWLWDYGRPAGASGGTETALDILKKRYARGEINKEEFEAKKRDLL